MRVHCFRRTIWPTSYLIHEHSRSFRRLKLDLGFSKWNDVWQRHAVEPFARLGHGGEEPTIVDIREKRRRELERLRVA
jgi:hypothetical protein